MNAIQTVVRRARRRLILLRFVQLASTTLFLAWMLAAMAIIAGAVWVLPIDSARWNGGWIAGTSVVALLIAYVWASWSAPSLQRAASEVDTRFGLRERLSSAVALPPDDRETEMGRALIADATRRAEPLDVRERFSLAPSRQAWLPLLPAMLLAIALFLPPATPPEQAGELSATTVSQTAQTKTAAEVLRRKIQQQRSQAEAAGLKDAEEFFKKLEMDLNQLAQRPALDQKEAMIAMNDIKKQLDQRRDELGTPDQMRQALAKIDDVQRGPAGEVVKAIQKGDFAEAEKQVKALAEKLRDGALTEQEQQELKKQIEALRDQLAQANEKHQQAKQQLQQQLDQAKREGRTEDAAKLQQQMNQLQAQEQQMQQMQQMAEAMNQAAQAMQAGKAGEAAEALENLADQLGQLQSEMDQLQDLEDTFQSLAQSKDQMRCQTCSGAGCQSCQGDRAGNGDGQGASGSQPGFGAGQDVGPAAPLETSAYDTQVRGQPKQGRGIVAGFADGPNRKGVSREEIKEAVSGAINAPSDPLENQNLPKVERDHAREYFDRLRQGRTD